MSKIHVKNGTPIGSCSLCDTCSNAQSIRGYRESETLVICHYAFDDPIRLPFKVHECTTYQDRNKPDWEQMEKLAIYIVPCTSAKPAGFRRAPRAEQEVASKLKTLTD